MRQRSLLPAHLPDALLVGLLVTLAIAALPGVAIGDAVTETSDTISIVKEDEAPSNIDIALSLLAETPLTPDRVLIGRDDVFVDSMAAGVLQGDSPLLLVPPDGPVPDSVLTALAGTGASRVTLLGGEAALSPGVEAALAGAGYTVDREAGPSRFETATAIAAAASPTDTAMLVRAFPAADSTDPTQGFADSLSAGYLAAENGWPILLTQSDVLSTPTAEFISAQGYERVLILGGTAAVSDAVMAEVATMVTTVDRIAGPERFSTAVEIAKESGAESAADVARVTLVEGQGADAWAGGFAAAAHAALFDAPIVLSTGEEVPGPTEAWLQGGSSFAQGLDVDGVRMTCVTPFEACEEGRTALALPAPVGVTFTPATAAGIGPGESVTVSGAPDGAEASGTCLAAAPQTLPPDGVVPLSPDLQPGESCTLVVEFPLTAEVDQTESAAYTVVGASAEPSLVSADPSGSSVGGEFPEVTPDGQVLAFVSAGDPLGTAGAGDHIYAVIAGEIVQLDVRPDGSSAEAGLAGLQDAPAPIADLNGSPSIVFASPDPRLDSQGRFGTDLGDNVYLRHPTAGVTQLLSLDADGQPVDNAEIAAIAQARPVVSFTGTGAATPGAPRSTHIFILDLETGQLDVVRDHTGAPFFNAQPLKVVISADGSTLVFASSRADLVTSDGNARPDVFAYDIATRTVELVSVATDGSQTTGEVSNVQGRFGVSGDGNLVTFRSAATNLGGGGTGPDIFLRDRAAGTTTLVSDRGDGTAFEDGTAPGISANGRWVSFASTGAPLSATVTGGCGIWRADLQAGTIARMDVSALGEFNESCAGAHTSVTDAGEVIFASDNQLVPDDTGLDRDVYRSGP